MSFSAALQTLIGLVFVFALVSLFCSALTETVSNLLEKRARYLLTGLRSMLDEEESARPAAAQAGGAPVADEMHKAVKDPGASTGAVERVRTCMVASAADAPGMRPGDLTLALFGHPLIRSLQGRRVRPGKGGRVRNPQYIPARMFARALVDTLLPEPPSGGGTADADVLHRLENAVSRLDKRFPARQSVLALIRQASGDLQRFEDSLADWYDAQMGRISGWYKRWSKVLLGIAGLLVAIVANVDSIQVAHGLYVDEPVRQAVVAQATNGTVCQNETDPAKQRACVNTQLTLLDTMGLPIWYPAGCDVRHVSSIARCWNWSADQTPSGWRLPLKLLGWALTALAVSFGAPFWFDALSKLGSLRTSGPKPAT